MLVSSGGIEKGAPQGGPPLAKGRAATLRPRRFEYSLSNSHGALPCRMLNLEGRRKQTVKERGLANDVKESCTDTGAKKRGRHAEDERERVRAADSTESGNILTYTINKQNRSACFLCRIDKAL